MPKLRQRLQQELAQIEPTLAAGCLKQHNLIILKQQP